MVNASSCTVELWMYLGGLLSSQELESLFIDVISVLNGNMKHALAIEFDYGEYSSYVRKKGFIAPKAHL